MNTNKVKKTGNAVTFPVNSNEQSIIHFKNQHKL